ncbi:MAG: Zn-dependent hydrolase, partial [Rhodobacteraceae bacterium]|nr:Zn-dependent hydrolase [Paracoccaceae bacterium]
MAVHTGNLRIDDHRLWESIHAMAEIGPGVAGGNNRQALTDADGEGRELFRTWCSAAGCTVGVD